MYKTLPAEFFKKTKFNFEIYDIDQRSKGAIRPDESILSYGVDLLNVELASLTQEGDYVLEVGCGRRSYFHEIKPKSVKWFGLDVYEFDEEGRESIVTEIGSVHDMPYEDATMDFVLANQSLEHWFEYGVSVADGLQEIARVLKPSGQAWINFPLFLHGDPRCLRGDLNDLLLEVPFDLFEKAVVQFVTSEKYGAYKGWRKCGFPDFLVNAKSSININLILQRSDTPALVVLNKPQYTRLTKIQRLKVYGAAFLIWKFFAKLFDVDREKAS